MFYALNLYNIKKGKRAQYKQYILVASPVLESVGGKVVAGGHNPHLSSGDEKARNHFLLVQYPDRAALKEFSRLTQELGVDTLRNQATTDYIWTLFDPWVLEDWNVR